MEVSVGVGLVGRCVVLKCMFSFDVGAVFELKFYEHRALMCCKFYSGSELQVEVPGLKVDVR